jgi:hypothetical protein
LKFPIPINWDRKIWESNLGENRRIGEFVSKSDILELPQEEI